MSRGSAIRAIRIRCKPLTVECWGDLLQLFGPRGACGGCWCMAWRLRRTEYERGKGGTNRQRFYDLVKSGAPVGVLAYRGIEPVGWCAIGPREDLLALQNSRILRPIDDKPVWSISCFFVPRGHRRCGVSKRLVQAAVEYARSQGAKTLEAYPHDLEKDAIDTFVWTGVLATFRGLGFRKVARRSAKRPIIRIRLDTQSGVVAR